MANPNKTGGGFSGFPARIQNLIDFSNSSGIGAGGTPTLISYVMPADGGPNAFSQADWNAYAGGEITQSSEAQAFRIGVIKAVMILGASVLTS